MKSLQGWHIYLIRGVFALILGTLLFTQRAQWNVVQYMGIFWLTIGLTSIVWACSRGKDIRLARWSLLLVSWEYCRCDRFIATIASQLFFNLGNSFAFRSFNNHYRSSSHYWRIQNRLGLRLPVGLGSYMVGFVQVILGLIVIIYPWEPIWAVWLMASILSIISMQWYPICTATEPGMKVERRLSVNKFQELTHS
jgi:uncharacterized membrane protein HdeD (DUF308 family)